MMDLSFRHGSSNSFSVKVCVDAKCHLEPILGPKMIAKSVPKCSKIGPETALKGDSDSKLKKEGAKSVEGLAPELRQSTNWRVLGPLGEGERDGADGFTRLTTLSKDKGSADK